MRTPTGARGRRARTEFELSGYSVFSVLRLSVRGRLVQAMVLAPFEDVCSRSFGPPPCVVPSHYVVGVDGIEVLGFHGCLALVSLLLR